MGNGQGILGDPGEHAAPSSAIPRTIRRIVREELRPLIDLAEEIRTLLRADLLRDGGRAEAVSHARADEGEARAGV